MNRSFSQRQEIDCSCFDFDIKHKFVPFHPENIPRPFINARELNNNFQKNQKHKLEKKFCMKKSLKRKQVYPNQSTELKRQKQDKKVVINQPKDCIDQNSQQRYMVLAQGSIIQKQNIQGRKNLDEIHVSLKNPSKFKHRPNVISDFTNISPNKEPDITQLSKAKSFFQIYQKQQTREKPFSKKNRTYLKSNDYSEVQIFSKTIKKRHSLATSIYNMTGLTESRSRQDGKLRPDQESIRNFKRVSIRGELNTNDFQKYQLELIYPKEIQSFEQDNFSATQSLVIQKGRYTWAPDGSEKMGGKQFISSLHINQTDRNSRRSNRVSKMISGGNI